MIKAKHHWFFKCFFNWYALHIISEKFSSVKCFGEWTSNGKASMVIGNHISWWDGFWAMYLNNRFLKKQFYVMMLEEELARRKIFSKAGAYSINPGRRSVIQSLDYTGELLTDEKNCVVLFPQGKFASIYNSEIKFKQGIQRIFQKTESFQLLFYAAFIDYFANKKPILNLYLSELDYKKYKFNELEQCYQRFYSECLKKQASKTK